MYQSILAELRKIGCFVVIGGVNTIVGLLAMLVGRRILLLPTTLAMGMNYSISSITSYFLNRKYTFGNRNFDKRTALRFAVHILFCYFVSTFVLSPLLERFFVHINIFKTEWMMVFCGMVIFSVLNFCGQNTYVFASQKFKEFD